MTGLRTYLSSLSLALATVACGPPGLGPVADADGDGDGDSETSTTTGSEPSTTTITAEPDPTDEDTSTDESSDGSLTFVPETELGGCECDPFAQDCPDGEKCVAYASTGETWDANKCVPVTGSQTAGEPCSYGGIVDATDDCDVDSACWEVEEIDGAWSGVCHSFCMGTPDDPVCPAPSRCLISSEGSVTLCIDACDPLVQDCGDGFGCYWSGVEFECAPTTSNIPAGEPCEFVNDCAAGLICVGNETLPSCAGASCCTSFCDLTLGDAQCDALLPGTACVAFYEEGEWPPDGQDLGLCTSL